MTPLFSMMLSPLPSAAMPHWCWCRHEFIDDAFFDAAFLIRYATPAARFSFSYFAPIIFATISRPLMLMLMASLLIIDYITMIRHILRCRLRLSMILILFFIFYFLLAIFIYFFCSPAAAIFADYVTTIFVRRFISMPLFSYAADIDASLFIADASFRSLPLPFSLSPLSPLYYFMPRCFRYYDWYADDDYYAMLLIIFWWDDADADADAVSLMRWWMPPLILMPLILLLLMPDADYLRRFAAWWCLRRHYYAAFCLIDLLMPRFFSSFWYAFHFRRYIYHYLRLLRFRHFDASLQPLMPPLFLCFCFGASCAIAGQLS